MAKRKIKKRPQVQPLGALQTGASLARRIGVHRGTVTRALRRVQGGTKTRLGHEFAITPRVATAVKSVIKRGG